MCMARSMKRTRITACPLFMTMMCPVLFVLFVTDPLSECFQVKRPLTKLNVKMLYYDRFLPPHFRESSLIKIHRWYWSNAHYKTEWETSTHITNKQLPILTRNKTVLIGVIFKYMYIYIMWRMNYSHFQNLCMGIS